MPVFFVPGLPAPQGSKRAIMNRRTGRAHLVESCGRVVGWRTDVATVAMRHFPAGPIATGVSVVVDFYLPRPKSHYRKDGTVRPTAPERPIGRPDVDKLLRAVGDALTGVAYRDDAQIVTLTARKLYEGEGKTIGASVVVTEGP